MTVEDHSDDDSEPIKSFTPRNDGWHQVSEVLKTLLTELKSKLK